MLPVGVRRGAGVQHLRAGGRRLVEAVDGIAGTGRARVARGGEHDRDAWLGRQPQRPVLEPPSAAAIEDLDQILVDAREQALGLGVAEPAVELDDLRPLAASASARRRARR